jgi:hypothetical protein
VADVLDLSELEVVAKVGELDRANLHEGQEVSIALDAIPEKKFRGKIKGMSGTASANVFSGDPAKKFDVIFSIDMRELLKTLNVKPDQIEKIMATAERNAKRAPSPSSTGMFAMMSGGGMPRMAGGAEVGPPQMFPTGMQGSDTSAQGGEGQQGGGRGMRGMRGEGRGEGRGGEGRGGEGRGGEGRMRFGGDLSPEDQQKMREALQKELNGRSMRDLSPEDRQAIFAKVRAAIGGGAGKTGETKTGEAKADAKGGPAPAAEEGEGGRRRGGMRMGGPAGADMPGGNPLDLLRMSAMASQRFTQQDRDNAKLPRPPEEDSGLDVLLRPGLLADVEITVEKIPNALHVPAQAVFERNGKSVVFVRTGKGFQERPVQLVKRSESIMVLSGGVNPGETIAMGDPFAPKDGKKGDKKSGGGGASPMGGMPAGGGK